MALFVLPCKLRRLKLTPKQENTLEDTNVLCHKVSPSSFVGHARGDHPCASPDWLTSSVGRAALLLLETLASERTGGDI